jgi:hypothetical protein
MGISAQTHHRPRPAGIRLSTLGHETESSETRTTSTGTGLAWRTWWLTLAEQQGAKRTAPARSHDDQLMVAGPRLGDDRRAGGSAPEDLVDCEVAGHGVDGRVKHGLVLALDLAAEVIQIDRRLVAAASAHAAGSGTTVITVSLPLFVRAMSTASAKARWACVEPSKATRGLRNIAAVSWGLAVP